MTGPVRLGEGLRLLLAAWSVEEGQGEGSDADAKGQQRRDGVAGMGGPLAWWPSAVPEPLPADDPGQQQRASGDEQRDGVGHGWMLPDARPWVLRAWRDGGP
jgi:hypothetical protein